MLTVQSIADALNRWAPAKLAEDWDNVGLLVGAPTAQVRRILVCLDVSLSAINKAVELDAQMIVSHHPMIFRPIKNVRLDRPLGRRLETLLKNDLAVFAAHTNLDSTVGGVNDVLASRLGLVDVKMLGGDDEPTLGRLGRLTTPMSAIDFARHVKQVLRAEYVRLVEAEDAGTISKVGLCGGAGADLIMRARFYGAEAFVTGDVKYHEAQAASEAGIHVVDAGHFSTEYPIVEVIADKLRAEFPETDVIVFDGASDIFSIV